MPVRVAQVGTFDVANFGDLLFPLLARTELERRLGPIEHELFSSGAKRVADGWPFDVAPMERLGERVADADLVLVGGGDIVRTDPAIGGFYAIPETELHHPTSLWAAATTIAAAAGVPVAWNAPGLVRRPGRWIAPLLAAAARSATYLAVRDSESAAWLAELAPDLDPQVVPDTAVGVRGLLPAEPGAAYRAQLDELEVRPPYIVVQPSPALRGLAGWVAEAIAAARERGYDAVELPVSPVVGDRAGELGELDAARPARWPDPVLLAELLARSSGVIGVSLHAAIVAAAAGVPVLRPDDRRASKYRILEDLDGIELVSPSDHPDPGVWTGADRDGPGPDSRFARLERRLARHWDDVAGLVADPPAPTDARQIVSDLAIAVAGPLSEVENAVRRAGELERERNDLRSELDAVTVERDTLAADLELARATLARRSARTALAAADRLQRLRDRPAR